MLLLVLTAGTAAGCSRPERVTRQSFYFDTICEITVYDMEKMTEKKASEAIEGAFSLCAGYEKLLSRTVEGSDVDRLNRAGGAYTELDPRTVDLLRQAEEVWEISGGAFDVTVGPVTRLWDFHGDGQGTVPDPGIIEEAVRHVGMRHLTIGEDGASLDDPEAAVDLGGIAKGYIADRVAEYLREQGVTGAVINLGGNIECVGSKPAASFGKEREPFRIGIELPYSDRTQILGSLEVTSGTVVTSGVYERFFVADGKEYHHILDPATGYPAQTDVLSVTLVSQEGRSADCDALATACLLLGREQGLALLEAQDGIEALIVGTDGQLLQTSGMVYTPAK